MQRSRLKPDLDLVFPPVETDDFERIARLIADRDSCLMRIAFLDAVRSKAMESNPTTIPRKLIDTTEAIEAIRELGAIDALKPSRFDSNLLNDLVRDRNALWRAHCASVAHSKRIASGEPVEPNPGLTKLARLNKLDAFQAKLQPYLPSFLRVIEMNVEHADQVLKFVVDDLKMNPLQPGEHVYERLPKTIVAYAKANDLDLVESPNPLNWRLNLEEVIVDYVLIEESSTDFLPRQLIQQALATKCAKNRLDLLHVEIKIPSDVDEKMVGRIRRDLFSEATTVYNTLVN